VHSPKLDIFDPLISPFYPVIDKTHLLRLAFKYASPKFEKRNLALSCQFFRKLTALSPGAIMESKVFKNRCDHGTPAQRVKCAFLHIFMLNYRNATLLFQQAAHRGDFTAALMYGLLLFHGIGQARDVQLGANYLAKCVTDPIALIHLGVAADDEEWLERAATILNVRSASPAMYEWVGDLFADGVKLPMDTRVARIWYSWALMKSQEDSEDNGPLREKMAKFS
jgi:TPR repeat protein